MRALHGAANKELVGAYVTSADKDGRDVGDICCFGTTADQPPGIRTFINMPPVIGRGEFSDQGVAG